MEAREIEQMLRRVVREELAALRKAAQTPPVPRRELPRFDPPEDGRHPFDLSDRELGQAETLIPEEERPILRQRVMALRLERKGNRASAKRMRRKADQMEARLKRRA